jgi:hypothetical protein
VPTISNIFVLLDCKSLFPFFIYASKDQYCESPMSTAAAFSVFILHKQSFELKMVK